MVSPLLFWDHVKDRIENKEVKSEIEVKSIESIAARSIGIPFSFSDKFLIDKLKAQTRVNLTLSIAVRR